MINNALNGLMNAQPGFKPDSRQKRIRSEYVLGLLQDELTDDFESFINISQPNVVMKSMPKHQAYVVTTPLAKTCMVQLVLRETGLTHEDIIGFIDNEIPKELRPFKIHSMRNHKLASDSVSIHMSCTDDLVPAVIHDLMLKLHPVIH